MVQIKMLSAIVISASVAACAQPTSEADLASHYKAEAYLRELTPVKGQTVFYLIPVDGGGPPAGIKINGISLDMHIHQNGFYAFCLPQGRYNIEYIAPSFSKNTIESFSTENSDHIFRGINTNIMWGNMSVRPLEKIDAINLISSKRMLPPPIPRGLPATRSEVGIYADYMAFPYRCRL